MLVAIIPRIARHDATLWALLCAIACSLALSRPLQAQTATRVLLQPAEATVAAGEATEIVLWIDGVTDLYGAEVHLRFDPAILQVQDAVSEAPGTQIQPGPFLDPSQGFLAANRVDNGTGEVIYAITLLAPAPSVTGSGELARFSVVGIAPGRSEWQMEEVILASREGSSIPFETEMAWVAVTGGQTATVPPTEAPIGSPSATTAVPTRPLTEAPPGTTVAPTASQTPGASATMTGPATQQPVDTAPATIGISPKTIPATEIARTTSTPEVTSVSESPMPAPGTQTAVTPFVEATVATAELATRAPGATVGSSPSAPIEAVPTVGSGEEGASLSALPAILVALVVAMILIIGRHLFRQRQHKHQRMQ